MESTIARIRTYKCFTCGYKHITDYDPYDPGMLQQEFPACIGITEGDCPACFSGKNPQRIILPSKLTLVDEDDDMSITTVVSDAELEGRMVEELDTSGRTIMVEAGSHWELRLNPQTGEIYSEEVIDYVPKMRYLTTQELAELKQQRDQNLDALESITVKEL